MPFENPLVWMVLVQSLVGISLLYLWHRSKDRRSWTELCKMNIRLASNERWLRDLLANTPSIVFIKGADDWRYRYINETEVSDQRLRPENILGKSDFDLWPPETAAMLREHDEAVRRSNIPMTFEETLPLADGLRTFIVAKFPTVWDSCAICGVATDITDRKLLEDRLRSTVADLVEQIDVLEDVLKRDFRCIQNSADSTLAKVILHLRRVADDQRPNSSTA